MKNRKEKSIDARVVCRSREAWRHGSTRAVTMIQIASIIRRVAVISSRSCRGFAIL